MINRNAYHNAMRCGTLLSTPRPDAQHRATPLVASQRNSTICLFVTTPLFAAMCISARRISTQLSDFFVINASLLFAPPLDSAQRFVFYQRAESIRGSRPLNSTQRFVCHQRLSARRNSAILYAAQCFSTQRFVYYPRLSALLDNARRNATLLNST